MKEIGFGSARGGKKPAADLVVEVVRGLTEDDLLGLEEGPEAGPGAVPLLKVRQSHHELARMMSLGRPAAEISLVTGYSASRQSVLKADPAFAELLAHYATQREMVHVDVLEKLRVLGLNTVEELQQRLEESPEEFAPRDLMELVKLSLVDGRSPGSSPVGQAAAAPVSISVKFVTAQQHELIEGTVVSGKVLEG